MRGRSTQERFRWRKYPMYKILAVSILVAVAASLPSHAGENGCAAEPGCEGGGVCGGAGGLCCPRCGCHEGLLPVCHPYVETKTITKYRYCCVCEDKCIPGVEIGSLVLHGGTEKDGDCSASCGIS